MAQLAVVLAVLAVVAAVYLNGVPEKGAVA